VYPRHRRYTPGKTLFLGLFVIALVQHETSPVIVIAVIEIGSSQLETIC
jgi:hypothetical protein